MATGMLGANTEELRALAKVFQQKADEVRNAETITAPEVEGVRWEGPDADAFRRRYSSDVVPDLAKLVELLDGAKGDLERQAGEQDICSQGKGGAGGPGQGGPRSDDPGFLGAIKMLYKDWNFFRKPGQALRFALEAIAAGRNIPGLVKPWFSGGDAWRRWETLTGRIAGSRGMDIYAGLAGDVKKLQHIEGAAEDMFGPLYRGAKGYTDFLGGNNWLSKPLEARIPGKFYDSVIDFVGKEGRLASRGLGALGVGFDGAETLGAIRDGNWTGNGDMTKGALWNGAQTALGVACFVPGPVGWAATGVSAGMAVYENWDTISNAAVALKDNAGQAIQDGAGALMDHGGKILKGLNPFD